MKHPVQVTRETEILGPQGHLLHKATLPTLADVADLPNKINTGRQPK